MTYESWRENVLTEMAWKMTMQIDMSACGWLWCKVIIKYGRPKRKEVMPNG